MTTPINEFNWDEAVPEDDYIKFENPGATVTGRITNLGMHTWDNGDTCPKLTLNVNGEVRTLTAGQTRLKRQLAELRPKVGDTITVTYTESEKRPGGKTLKHFDVEVTSGDTAPTAAALAPAPAPEPVAGFTADQLKDLNPEQIAALSKLGG